MSNKYDVRIPLGIMRVVKRIELSEYNEDLGNSFLTVWVNIDSAMTARWNEYKDEEAKLQKLLDSVTTENAPQILVQARQLEAVAVPFYADLWDMPLEDARAFYDANKPLFVWCVEQTWRRINEYRSGRPKA